MADEHKMLGAKIRALRELRHWSRDEFADKLGVSRQAVEHWEAGRRTPPLKRLPEVAEALGVHVVVDLGPAPEALDDHAAEIILRLAEVLRRVPRARRKLLVAQLEELEERYPEPENGDGHHP